MNYFSKITSLFGLKTTPQEISSPLGILGETPSDVLESCLAFLPLENLKLLESSVDEFYQTRTVKAVERRDYEPYRRLVKNFANKSKDFLNKNLLTEDQISRLEILYKSSYPSKRDLPVNIEYIISEAGKLEYDLLNILKNFPASQLKELLVVSDFESFYLVVKIYKQLEKANTIIDLEEKIKVIIDALKEFAKVGKFDLAIRTVEKTPISNRERNGAFKAIAIEAAKVGKFDLAIKTAEKIPISNRERNSAFNEIAIEAAKARKFDLAIKTAGNISEYSWRRNDAFKAIAIEFAKTEQFDLAIGVARKIPKGLERSYIYRAIAIEFAKVGKFDLAMRAVEKTPKKHLIRSYTLGDVIREATKIGQEDLAREAARKLLT